MTEEQKARRARAGNHRGRAGNASQNSTGSLLFTLGSVNGRTTVVVRVIATNKRLVGFTTGLRSVTHCAT